MRLQTPFRRSFKGDISGPHTPRGIIDHVVITGMLLGMPSTTTQLTATAYDVLGQVVLGMPVAWRSMALTVATVSATGLVTFLAFGSASITATVDGRDYTVMVSTPAAGSIDDVLVTIGSSNIDGFWSLDTNVTTAGGGTTLSKVDDVRGAVGFLPITASGSPLPAYDAATGTVTFDGAQNFAKTVADARFTLNATRWVAYVGSNPSSNQKPVSIHDEAGGFAPEFAIYGNAPNVSSYCDFGPASLDRPVALGATVRLQIVTFELKHGSTGTLNGHNLHHEVPQMVRAVLNDVGSAAPSNNARSVQLAHLNTEPGFFDFNAVRAVITGRGVPSRAWIDALVRFAVRRGATLVAGSAKKALIALGDSITAGTGASNPATTSWFGLLQTQLAATYDCDNRGRTARTAAEIVQLIPTQLLSDANPARSKNWLVLWAGTNDVTNGGATGAATYAILQNIADQWRTAGGQVLCITAMKRTDATGGLETELQALNTSVMNMVSSGHADAVYNARLDCDPTNVGVDSADGVHPNDTAYARLKTGISNALTAAGL